MKCLIIAFLVLELFFIIYGFFIYLIQRQHFAFNMNLFINILITCFFFHLFIII